MRNERALDWLGKPVHAVENAACARPFASKSPPPLCARNAVESLYALFTPAFEGLLACFGVLLACQCFADGTRVGSRRYLNILHAMCGCRTIVHGRESNVGKT